MEGKDIQSLLRYNLNNNQTTKIKFPTPRYIVTIDTEEEFDWNKPFTRDEFGLDHINAIDRFQKLCNDNGVMPIYLVDYPVVDNDAAVELISYYCVNNQAHVGIQLHPWVNPPFTEEITTYNSYACNLAPDLEREKLTNLCNLIAKKFNITPSIYRAGRYGAGSNSVEVLNDLGVKIDTSVRSRFSYINQHGPDYSKFPVNPYWLIENQLLELPVTTVFTGALGSLSDMIYHDIFESKLARSLLSRSKLIERIALTPEGTPIDKALAGIDRTLTEGIEILNFSFHSPSLAPGYTPYVSTEADLELFYKWWDDVFAYLSKHQIKAASLDDIINLYFTK